MSVIISAYCQTAYKEYLLPATDNADTSIILYKDLFGLPNDVTVALEIIGSKWMFPPSADYQILKNTKDHEELYFEREIRGGDVLVLRLPDMRAVSLIVRETDSSFSAFTKYDITGVRSVSIGSDPGNDICVNILGLVSHRHAVLEFTGTSCILRDNHSRNGVYVNTLRVQNSCEIRIGDLINVLGLQIIWLGNLLAVNEADVNVQIRSPYLVPVNGRGIRSFAAPPSAAVPAPAGDRLFHRAPRNLEELDTDTVEIEIPPRPGRLEQRSVLATIGPSFTMAIPMLLGTSLAIYANSKSGSGTSPMMYTGLITAVGAAFFGSLWAVINLRNARKKALQEERDRREAYSGYLIKKEQTVEQKYQKNTAAMSRMYPSADACSRYDMGSVELWSRNPSQKDFLFARLGLGSVPFQCAVDVPKEKFSVYKDPLEDKPAEIRERYRYLHNVPVGTNLQEHQLIGILGGRGKTGAYQAACALMTQIAASNAYTEVKMALVYNREKSAEDALLGAAKWFPHVWSEDRKTRFVADNRQDAADVFYELVSVVRSRAEEEGAARKGLPLPWYVLFVTEPSFLEGELISKYVMDPRPEYGLTTVLLYESYEELPNTCRYVIENDAAMQGSYTVGTENSERQHIVFDGVDPACFAQFAKRLANIRVFEQAKSGEIPGSLTFLEMYQAKRMKDLMLESRWAKNRSYESMRAIVGVKSGGAPCYLDIHEKYHGPHGLIAGTTGSGKSETLQTYILSLALNFSPDDVGFFIIDYKGGGMANLFTDLPHMMGQVSNLSGNQVRRAMISIKSENQRRQRVFNENGVNNINQYTRLYKNNETSLPVPHLFIIIDEFAELKREQPEFMQELISVAQVGRSLGVHLILSTQKPAGTVDDNIWSNSKFRLCLRVQDKQDSMDMLHKPDAAFITQAGRCYLQVGNDELYELFQSGWSGAAYDAREDGEKTEIVRMLTATGKTAMTGNRLKIARQEKRRREWIASLLAVIDRTVDREMLVSERQFTSPQVLDQIFGGLSRAGIDYPENDYNMRRMTELLRLNAQVGCELPAEARAGKILSFAFMSGSKLPEGRSRTQLEAVVEYIADTAKRLHFDRKFMLWLPVLPSRLYLEDLEGFRESAYRDGSWQTESGFSLSAFAGLIDDPVNQAQLPLSIDFAKNGHHAVIGSVVSGKSTFAQTLVWSLISRYDPEHLNLYLIDFSSHLMDAFAGSPHVGGIMNEETPERIAKFFRMMGQIMAERKKLFAGGNYEQYTAKNGCAVPAVVLVIDQYAAFREKTGDAYTGVLNNILRDGGSYGIYVLITAGGFGGAEIERRLADNIRTVVSLELADRYAYADAMHTTRIDVLPEEGVKGRGLAKTGDAVLEFQTALAFPAETDYDRMEQIAERIGEMRASWSGRCARPVPEIPEKPVLSDFLALAEEQEAAADPALLPMGWYMEDASPAAIDLTKTYCYLVTGKRKSGKTNFLRVLLAAASQKGAKTYLFDRGKKLKKAAEEAGAVYLSTCQELYASCVELQGVFLTRNRIKKAAVAEGQTDRQIFVKMQEEQPVFILIDDLADFIQAVSHPDEGVSDMSRFFGNITDKGSLHNIYFIAAFNPEEAGSMIGSPIYQNMIRDRQGIHFGGNVTSQRLFTFDYISYTQQTKPKKPGLGLLPSGDEETDRHEVVVPLAE